MRVPTDAPARNLVAYSNHVSFVLGPRGLRCSGSVGADGGNSIVAWPRGQHKPADSYEVETGVTGGQAGLTLTAVPACSSCKIETTCPYFKNYWPNPGYASCTEGIPAGEQHRKLSRYSIEFRDPPRVFGTGFPSGGQFEALGLVAIYRYEYEYDHHSYPESEPIRDTCTLPSSDRSACAASLDFASDHVRSVLRAQG